MRKILLLSLLALSGAVYADGIGVETDQQVLNSEADPADTQNGTAVGTDQQVLGANSSNGMANQGVVTDQQALNSNTDETDSATDDDTSAQMPKLVGADSASLPPAYLQVKDFKKCLATENMRGWMGYCMPTEQPESCPDDSWSQLKDSKMIACRSNDGN